MNVVNQMVGEPGDFLTVAVSGPTDEISGELAGFFTVPTGPVAIQLSRKTYSGHLPPYPTELVLIPWHRIRAVSRLKKEATP